MPTITPGQFALVYNAFSFTIAAMGAATLFLWISRSQVGPSYKTALTISGLVTAIAAYHYLRIFESWDAAYVVTNGSFVASGRAFNDAYRYVDWLLTVPLLLIELILVMKLSVSETWSKSIRLGVLAAVMVALGYPGEIATDVATKWIWWGAAMIPFGIIVYDLYVGLGESIELQPENVRGLVSSARNLTVVAWCFYPVVFILPLVGFSSSMAAVGVQVGYTIADVVAKAVFGILIYMIAIRKTEMEQPVIQIAAIA
jgi:bacteriorhodopsin